MPRRRALALLCSVPIAALPAIALAPHAQAASSSVVIAQAFGGGGNSGAPYVSDFVELYNRSGAAVDLTGWKLQYWSAAGTTATSTALSGSIDTGHHYLIKEADGSNTAAPALPTPDATGTIAMSATAGRVAIVDANGTTIDLLGYGSTASVSETAPAPAPSNTLADVRTSSCTDTDNNATDFVTAAPAPNNSASAIGQCGTTGGGGGTTPPPPPTGQDATIEQIQGAAHRSPLEGKAVKNVTGVVTATSKTGYWIQSTTPDDDPATSEGLFVFTKSAPSAKVGDAVTAAGTVSEYRPGGSSGTANLTTTELTNPTTTVTSSGNPLPAPVVIGKDRIAPQQTVKDGDPGDIETAGTFDPTKSAIDFDESLEGMRVELDDAVAVGPTNASYGETPVIPGQNVTATRSARGGVVYGGYDQPNAMRLILDDSLLPSGAVPTANVGDVYEGSTIGVLDYTFGNFHLLATSAGTVKSAGLQRETTSAQSKGQVAVATFNVENLAPSDPQTKFDRLAGQIVGNLKAPDIVALEEIQDNSGATDDGTVDSTDTITKLIAAIKAAGGPSYQARWINPTNDTDGGQPGGNIRQVFIFRTDRGVSFTDIPGGDATTATSVVGKGWSTKLSASPGRIDPTNGAWTTSRKPLVGQFSYKGQKLFVIANHFNSKGGDDPLFGRFQQPLRSSETQRHNQATAVRGFVDSLLKADPLAKVIVLGDLNDFEFSQTADILVGSGRTALTDLPRTLPANERYTYDYEGNSQVLDHILISKGLQIPLPFSGPAYRYDVVHTNAEFSDQDSDHDPQVVRLQLWPSWLG